MQPSTRRYPPLLLVLQMAVAGILLHSWDRFQATPVQDTPGYVDFPFQSVPAALSAKRTPGYPVFLVLVESITGSHAAAPVAVYLVYCVAATAVYAALCSLGGSGWRAAWIAGSLLAASALWGYVDALAGDTLATAVGIIAAAFVIRYHGECRRPRWVLAGVAAATAAAWLIRPASLFLVAAVPVISTLLAVRTTAGKRRLRNLARHAGCMALVVGAPLLAWCVLRWQVVGKFGVVSFGGYNLVGIAGQFLEPDDVARLPADLRPLARAALDRRGNLPHELVHLPDAGRLNYTRMERSYDVAIWYVFAPAAGEVYGDDDRVVNTQLRRLATAIIRIAPQDYLVWLAKALRQGVRKIVSDFVVNPVGLALTLGALAAGLVSLLRRWRSHGQPAVHPPSPVVGVLFVTAACYAAFSLACTILVCPPLGRMTDAAAVWLYPLITGVLLEQLAGAVLRTSRRA